MTQKFAAGTLVTFKQGTDGAGLACKVVSVEKDTKGFIYWIQIPGYGQPYAYREDRLVSA